jgi:hypothetical protein
VAPLPQGKKLPEWEKLRRRFSMFPVAKPSVLSYIMSREQEQGQVASAETKPLRVTDVRHYAYSTFFRLPSGRGLLLNSYAFLELFNTEQEKNDEQQNRNDPQPKGGKPSECPRISGG